MELILLIVGIVVVSWLLSIPARRYEKRTGKKLGRGAGAAVLDSLNVIYQPSAAHSAEILNEQKEQRTAIPAATDKPFGDSTITIVVPEKS